MVTLVPMTDSEFAAYLEDGIRRYAEANVASGRSHPSEALERSRGDHARLLPGGLRTPNNYLFSIVDRERGERIGIVWYAVELDRPVRSAFIFDFLVFEQFRRRGYGKDTLGAVEEHAKSLGVEKLALHVFADNEVAQVLYRKVGYVTTDVVMAKKI